MSNNLLRILTGLVGIPVVVGVAYLGGWPFLALVAVMALLAQHEVYHLMRAAGTSPHVYLGLALGGLVLLSYVTPGAMGIAAAVLVVGIALSPFVRSRDGADSRPSAGGAQDAAAVFQDHGGAAGPLSMAATVFGIVYPTALLGFLVRIRGGDAGGSVSDGEAFALTISVLILVWTTDSLAYFVGRAIGKRPFAPTISPKKTWEGTIGGAVGAVAAGAVLKLTMLEFLSWPHVIAVAVLCGALGQLGDLAESRMKRMVGVKDSGALLPGHGGMLDRFDSMIVVAPAVYLYLHYVAGILG